jgi:hypothetical protein
VSELSCRSQLADRASLSVSPQSLSNHSTNLPGAAAASGWLHHEHEKDPPSGWLCEVALARALRAESR